MAASLYEFYKFPTKKEVTPHAIYGIGSGLLILFVVFVNYSGFANISYTPLIGLFFGPFIIEMYRKKSNPEFNIAYTILGIVYITLPIILVAPLVFPTVGGLDGSFNPDILLGAIIMVWVNDSGAYIVGSTFGKRRLFERISPKKSWEGFFGGMIFTIASAFVIDIFFELDLINWIIISIIVPITATFGDLTESMFKRSAEVKDSGNLIPGHGGMLDRFDSLLFVIPAVYLYVYIY